MICKVWNEEGDYLDITTDEPRNMLCAEQVWTPEGESHTWIGGFNTIEDAMEYFQIKLKPKPEEDADTDLSI